MSLQQSAQDCFQQIGVSLARLLQDHQQNLGKQSQILVTNLSQRIRQPVDAIALALGQYRLGYGNIRGIAQHHLLVHFVGWLAYLQNLNRGFLHHNNHIGKSLSLQSEKYYYGWAKSGYLSIHV